ncbi:MAG: protein translocase subunit SecD [Betaproteobacteria bacterium]|jgi:preprotein translocase subunit SecD|nr:protein translocase subunit SecD [Pseudomonadota bacterium]NBO95713.1 protein translocase subunit SecD [Betaproteobacteria bacterium]HAB47371.1 protein translocase subunit SecD [Lautropia sp.]NBP35556.1 protein translocase subunit SecD [Betaproteobacteria bacterium]NBP38146.1 protein translocase subunit SecD [Betaproteobacteria bacterium]
MNRYPLWKYVLMGMAFCLGLLYTLPNFFGEAPAVQVSAAKATVKLGSDIGDRIRQTLSQAGVQDRGVFIEANSIRVRLADTDQQLKAKDALQRSLNPDANDPAFVVALNLLSASPRWLSELRALPMYLGLDLRGGVHFLLQVDLKQAAIKRYDALAGDVRSLLRDKNLRHAGISREAESIRVSFRDLDTRGKSLVLVRESLSDVDWVTLGEGDSLALIGKLKPEAEKRAMENALKQNISTLNNRINELGVAEPIIAQQGNDRIVVQLPGVQDTAKAKDILGRTATLEVRMVCDSPEEIASISAGTVPFGCERYLERGGVPVMVRKQVILTGDNLTDAQAGFDSNTQEPAVHLSLDAKGARIFRDVTRENIGRRMAILLVEKAKGEVVTAPVIRSEIGGGRVQISGRMTTEEANDVALLLRAGSLAAPMEIIEERTIGPSLGAENISKGFHSTLWGFLAVTSFMVIYYLLFGVISSLALATNLLLLVAVLSLLQATLTLPGIAAIALTLGMAIDANVLINERIREELRNGASPQAAISAGYDRAWDTILDSNITTLIAGIALLVFGSGPVRGFAVVHCLGILTSMFSAVFFSRGLVAAWYGSRRKLAKLSIG